jgi:predicted component of type VI protein secretion system
MTDRSTKITYQNVLLLAREDAFYIIRASLPVAEEIAHLQAVGSATFSFALRPDTDLRPVDATRLGETTNRIIEKYGIPIPEPYPAGFGPVATPAPTLAPTPSPSASPAASDAATP